MRQFLYGSLIVLSGLGCHKEVQQPSSPETIWTTPLSSGTETASMNPVLYKDLVIYSADDGSDTKSKLIALNRNTGKLIWESKFTDFETGDMSISRTYVYNNIVIVPILGKPYRIVAIDMETGMKLWQTVLPEGGNHRIVGTSHFVFQVRSNFDSMKDEIWVADVNTGNWQSVYAASNVNAPIYIRGMHTYKADDSKNYLAFLVAKYKDFQFSETESTIFKYSIDSGKMVYQKTLDFLPKTSQPFLEAVALNQFWLSNDPALALREADGAKQAEFGVPFGVSTTTGKIKIVSNKLLMPTVNKLVCFDATTGHFLWQESGNTSGSPSRMLYYENVIYYTSGGNGNFHAMNATTGQEIYNQKSPDKKANGQGGFDSAITLDTLNRRIYTASYFSAICYKMPN